MSIYVTSLVWKFSKSDGSTLLTALAIADFCDDDGRAFPAVATLATKARISKRSAQYAIQQLRDLDELRVEVGSGPKGCNTYFVKVQNLRGAKPAGVQNTTEGGATGCTQITIEPSFKKKQDASAIGDVAFDVEAGSFTGLTPKQIAQWAAAYPKANVTLEIERAACWLICNPKKQPKQGEGLRFINGWISRSGGGQQLQTAAAIKPQAQQQSTRASRAEAFSAGLYSTPSTRSEAFMTGLSPAASRTEPVEVIDVDAIEIP